MVSRLRFYLSRQFQATLTLVTTLPKGELSADPDEYGATVYGSDGSVGGGIWGPRTSLIRLEITLVGGDESGWLDGGDVGGLASRRR